MPRATSLRRPRSGVKTMWNHSSNPAALPPVTATRTAI